VAKQVRGTRNGEQGIVLELQGIERWYEDGARKVQVLQGVDLTIGVGESVAIVGPSGSGKSTLLHVAGLLDKPSKGVVKVAGSEVRAWGDEAVSAVRNASFGFVYQFHHLLREFTAEENVMIPALIGGKATQEMQARAADLLKAVGLTKRAGHYPHELSGGEQQRVALARALMNKPKLLLADEPTGNLDPHTAEGVMEMLFGLIENEGMSALIVTHNLELAKQCGRQLAMNEGLLA
jgi:lipoprotein-releasing system ATP-binding protein